jgi:oxygen-dependent protoporphyrinogen oxidase
VVIGAGLSGLAAAVEIRRVLGAKRVTVDVLEAANRAGGKIWTERDGQLLHESGPNGWLDSRPSTNALVERLGLGPKVIQADDAAAHRFIVQRGVLRELPASAGAFLRSPILSLRGKLRFAKEPFVPRRDPSEGDESVADFGERRLGREAVTWLLDPFVTGIHAGDPARISVRAAFPRIIALEREYGGLVRGMIAKARAARRERKRSGERGATAGPAGPGGRLTSLEGGLRTLIEALCQVVGAQHLHLSTAATSLEFAAETGRPTAVIASGRRFPADHVLLALPGPGVAALFAGHPGKAALVEACRRIPYAAVAVVEMLFDASDLPGPVSGFGFLCPGVERRAILGSLWTSAIFPGARAPRGKILLRTLVGGRRQGELALLPESDLIATVLAELTSLMGLCGAPQRTLISRWPEAIPQYDIGHLERVAAVEAALPAGVHLLGNAFRGIGINECTAAAEAVGTEVAAELVR